MKEIENYNNTKPIDNKDVFFKLDEYEDRYVILCRLPGAIKEEISIDYDNDNIKISTFVRDRKENCGQGFYMSVTQSTLANKSFHVPNSDVKGIEGNFDGLYLNIKIPKILSVEGENETIEVEDFIDVQDYRDI